jgi:hypothetical protein
LLLRAAFFGFCCVCPYLAFGARLPRMESLHYRVDTILDSSSAQDINEPSVELTIGLSDVVDSSMTASGSSKVRACVRACEVRAFIRACLCACIRSARVWVLVRACPPDQSVDAE